MNDIMEIIFDESNNSYHFRNESEVSSSLAGERPIFTLSLDPDYFNKEFWVEIEAIRAEITCDDPKADNGDLRELSPLLIHLENDDLREKEKKSKNSSKNGNNGKEKKSGDKSNKLLRKMKPEDWKLTLFYSKGRLYVCNRGLPLAIFDEAGYEIQTSLDVSGAIETKNGKLDILFGQDKDNNEDNCANGANSKRKKDVKKQVREGIRINIVRSGQKTKNYVKWQDVVKNRIETKFQNETKKVKNKLFSRMETLKKTDPYLFHMSRLRFTLFENTPDRRMICVKETEFDLLNGGNDLTKKDIRITSVKDKSYCINNANETAVMTMNTTITGKHFYAVVETKEDRVRLNSGDLSVVVSGFIALVPLKGIRLDAVNRGCQIKILNKITGVVTNPVEIEFITHSDSCQLCQRTCPDFLPESTSTLSSNKRRLSDDSESDDENVDDVSLELAPKIQKINPGQEMMSNQVNPVNCEMAMEVKNPVNLAASPMTELWDELARDVGNGTQIGENLPMFEDIELDDTFLSNLLNGESEPALITSDFATRDSPIKGFTWKSFINNARKTKKFQIPENPDWEYLLWITFKAFFSFFAVAIVACLCSN